MQKIVIVHHLKDSQHYIFSVPEERDLEKGDLVLVRNSRGEVPAVCVCSSFSVPADVLATLQRRYGGSSLKPVIGSAELRRWDQEKRQALQRERITGRLTMEHTVGQTRCWEIKDVGGTTCNEVCEQQGDDGCAKCPISAVIDRLAAYENTGVSPEELQEVVNLFVEFVDPDVPAELKKWMDRCVWHVKKCNEQSSKIERLTRENEKLRLGISREDDEDLPY